jgi:hypothetical protein
VTVSCHGGCDGAPTRTAVVLRQIKENPHAKCAFFSDSDTKVLARNRLLYGRDRTHFKRAVARIRANRSFFGHRPLSGRHEVARQSVSAGLCGGRTVQGNTYLVKAVPISTILSWYRKAIPGATFFVVAQNPAESATTTNENFFLAPGNAQSVRVRQTISTIGVADAMPELSVVAIDFNRYSAAVTTDLLKARACRLY